VDKQTLTVIAVGVLVAAVVVTGIVVYYSLKLRGHGRIKTVGVGVYADPQCTQVAGEIDWGIIPQGGTSTVSLFIKNTGNSNVTLSLTSEAWEPSAAQQYMTLSWDYAGGWLVPAQVVAVNFRLDVSQSITGITDFSFDIVVTAQG